MPRTYEHAVRGLRHPHLQIAKSRWVSHRLRRPGGPAVEGVDLAVLDRAACAGTNPELFFDNHPCAVDAAKEICRSCPVRKACRARALANGEEHGVFGGLTADERAARRRKGLAT
ncbi:WhiB family transcriptional regulator [Streptomyces sp. NPDC001262]|uniref:WhiB family transcriptional regulator n=1 Tax=Streptomyces sp. NPDC001262 TaxID=3364552 RepID=UPI00367AB1D9